MIWLWAALAWADEPLPPLVGAALVAGNPKTAVKMLEDALNGSRLDERPWLLLYAGEERRLLGDLAAAREHFQAVATDFPSSKAARPAKLGIALVDSMQGSSGNTDASLALFGDENVPPSLNADRYLLLAHQRAAEGADAGEVRALLADADQYAARAGQDIQKRVGRRADDLRQELPDSGAAATPAQTDEALIVSIRADIDKGDLTALAAHANDLLTRFPASTWKTEADYARRRAEAGAAPDRAVVSVLLPFTGTYALPAQSLRTAIELGQRDTSSAVKLKFHDTGGTGDGCLKELEKAVLVDKASVIIGPLSKEEAVPCATAAQLWHVPMLTFTSSDEPLAAGDMIFRASPSSAEQVEALLDVAYTSRGIHRYAIAHPRTPYGELAAKAFQASVVARGGTVVMIVPYDASAKDYRGIAGILARSSSDTHRYDVPGAPPISSDARGGSKIDYDGLFVPDAYPRSALLAAALAYQDVPIGTSPGKGQRGPIALLGLNGWNNDEWPRRGGAYVRGSLFVDAFDPRGMDSATQRFVNGWHGRSDAAPTTVEAVGYDTIRLVMGALGATDRSVPAALTSTPLADPVAGTSLPTATRSLGRTWTLFSVEGDQVVAVSTIHGAP